VTLSPKSAPPSVWRPVRKNRVRIPTEQVRQAMTLSPKSAPPVWRPVWRWSPGWSGCRQSKVARGGPVLSGWPPHRSESL